MALLARVTMPVLSPRQVSWVHQASASRSQRQQAELLWGLASSAVSDLSQQKNLVAEGQSSA